MTQFILETGKHGDSYYDASTIELLDRSALELLEHKLGYDLIEPTETEYITERRAVAAMTDEEIANAPGGYKIKADLEQKRNYARDELRWHDERKAQVQRARELVKERSTVRTRTRTPRRGPRAGETVVSQYSEAWEFLQEITDGYEYGGVRLENLTTPKERI